MPATIAIPKKALKDVLLVGRRFLAAKDVIEDTLLASDAISISAAVPDFINGRRGQYIGDS